MNEEYDINEEVMNIVDSLGFINRKVNNKAYEHLLIYIPTKTILRHLYNKYFVYPIKRLYIDIKINFKYYLYNKGI